MPLITLAELALREGNNALALAHAQAALDIAIEVQARQWEVLALWHLGNAELALGRHIVAAAAFERGHTVALAIGAATSQNATAGLARVALAQGDVSRATRTIEGLLAHLAGGGSLHGTEQPRLIELVCHQVLARAGDPRAAAMLARAHTVLQTVAATIADPPLRQSYLANIPEHRAIIKAWAAQREVPAGGR